MRRIATVISCVLLAGCGSEAEPPIGNAEGDGTAAPPEQPEIELDVKVSEGEGTPDRSWALRCDPDGGDHPDVAAACDLLRTSGGPSELLGPVADDMQCTQIYGGPQVAKVTGRWGDERVDAQFSRSDGCEISRWDALEPLLPAVNAPG